MYIVGIDIAKRFHEAAIIDSSGKIIVKQIRFANSHTGFLKLMEAVRKLDAPVRHGLDITGCRSTLICVKTGKLFTLSTLCNPTIRQTKNDIQDALIVAEVIRFGRYCET